MTQRFTGLWRHPEFMRLWVAQTVSAFGSTMTGTALPLAALLVLGATPAEMGLLAAAGAVPVLLVGLLAGAWVDRLRRRPILIATDLGRALLLLSIPVAAWAGVLSMAQLYLVAILTGMLTVFFSVAYRAYLPSLVAPDELVEANAKLGTSDSVAEIGGSALAGVLVQMLTAPLTVLIDAISFVFSAVMLLLVRTPEPRPTPPEGGHDLWRDVAEGLRVTVTSPLLRALTGSDGTRSFFGSFYAALYSLFVIRELGMTPVVLGLLIGSGGIGALLGAVGASAVARRAGLGATLIGALALMGTVNMLIPLAHGAGLAALLLMFTAQIVGDMARAIYDINEVSLRQIVTPARLLGRTLASAQVLVGVAGTAGVLVGGFLGGAVGLRGAVAIAALGNWLAILWLLAPSFRRLVAAPAGVAEPRTEALAPLPSD